MGDVLIYLDPSKRQHNARSSCVFASITTELRSLHLWKEADAFWQHWRGPGDPNNTASRLRQSGIKFKMTSHGDEKALLAALDQGRPPALAWGGSHFVNLVGKVQGNAYIVDNNSPLQFKKRPWKQFLSEHRRCGGWGVIILDGWASIPKLQNNLNGYERSFQHTQYSEVNDIND